MAVIRLMAARSFEMLFVSLLSVNLTRPFFLSTWDVQLAVLFKAILIGKEGKRTEPCINPICWYTACPYIAGCQITSPSACAGRDGKKKCRHTKAAVTFSWRYGCATVGRRTNVCQRQKKKHENWISALDLVILNLNNNFCFVYFFSQFHFVCVCVCVLVFFSTVFYYHVLDLWSGTSWQEVGLPFEYQAFFFFYHGFQKSISPWVLERTAPLKKMKPKIILISCIL